MPNKSTQSRSPEQKAAGLTVARILIELGAVVFRPQNPYILTSGWASPVYIDCRKIISFPRARREVIRLAERCITRDIGYEKLDAVAGGETAGIPYASWLAASLDLPMLYVRKEPKGFGRMAQIEGDFDHGSRVLLVEDLATDGASKIKFCAALRDAGAEVQHAFVVFFYGVYPGAKKSLEDAGIDLHFLANWWDVFEAAEQDGYLDKDSIEEVRAFLHRPMEWSARHGGKGGESGDG